MRTLAIACVLLAVGCIRDNPDFAVAPGPSPATSNGPPVGDLAYAPSYDLGTPAASPDLSEPSAPDLGVGPGGGTGDPDPGVACGMQSCALPNVCCASLVGSSCLAPGSSCLAGKSMTCDGPEDCDNGETCCDGAFGSSCQEHCMGETLCHTQDDCHDGAKCCPQLLGYPTCRKFGC